MTTDSDEEEESTIEFERIVSSPEKRQLVIAAAGSGKTYLLIHTLAERIKRGLIDPLKEKVIVFTFTNSAADELFVRLSELLRTYNLQQVANYIYIGTIHGWCNNFLSDNGTLSNTKVIDELEQAQIVQRIYPMIGLSELYQENNQFAKMEQFLRDLEFFYNESLEITNEIIPDKVRQAIRNYISFLEKQRLMDFGYVIRESTSTISKRHSEEIIHLYVDEYQDVNPAQVKLIQAIVSSNKNSRLLAVGDPRQAIYQWRGGDVNRLLSFEDDFPDTEIHQRNVNRRSRSGIINFANLVASKMNLGSKVEVRDMVVSEARRDSASSVLNDNESFTHERRIVELVKRLQKNGTRLNDIAVLYRSVISHAEELMNEFGRANIPYHSQNRNRGPDFVRDFMGALIYLIEIAHSDEEPANHQELEEQNERIGISLDTISEFTNEKDRMKLHLAVAALHNNMHSNRARSLNEEYNFRGQLFEFCERTGFRIEPQQTELQEGFSAVTQIMKSIEEAYRRRFLAGYDSRPPACEVFLHNVKWQLNQQIERWTETGMQLTSNVGVSISTVHAAKGLEWPVVIIPLAWKNLFPLRRSNHGTSFPDSVAARYGTTIEDERRLWYVATTRARDRLYIFSASDGNHKPSEFTHIEESGPLDSVLVGAISQFKEDQLSTIEPHNRPFYIRIGVSDLLLLLECKYQFHLRKVSGIDVPVGEELGAGNIIHKAIQRMAAGDSQKGLDDIVDEEVYLPLAERNIEKIMKRSITANVNKLLDSKILKSVDSTEYRFEIGFDGIIVTGIVDATRKVGDSLDVFDWKYSIKEKFLQRYGNQLKIYAYALRMLGMKVSRAYIYDLKEGTLHGVNVSELEADEAIERAKAAFHILSNDGPIPEPSALTCSLCDVSSICPVAMFSSSKKR